MDEQQPLQPVQPPVLLPIPPVLLPVQLAHPSEEVLDAFRLIVELAGKNDSDKYIKLTSGNPSPIRLVCKNYHEWLNWKIGKNVEKKFLVVRKYGDWQNFIRETYGIDFTNIKYDTFRHDYKKLYIHDDLHDQAAQGDIRHGDIRKYGR
jgi:hypothetical protein